MCRWLGPRDKDFRRLEGRTKADVCLSGRPRQAWFFVRDIAPLFDAARDPPPRAIPPFATAHELASEADRIGL